jgi:FkbM family methyltransferase
LLHRLWKPWFVYRPTRLVRRAVTSLFPPSRGYARLRTSWGVGIIADPSRAIGHSIVTTGVFDIAVSEALARLISPGDTVVDAGANVGYMTVLASVVAGPRGRVLSFEPHPELFAIAQRNVTAIRERLDVARTELHQMALGDRPGTADLEIPPDFESNDGTARIGGPAITGNQSVAVQVETLDNVLHGETVAVLKLDVEGFEPQVLRGGSRALADRRVRHIVFEDHTIGESEVVRVLRRTAYHVFSLGWSWRGPRVQPVDVGCLATDYEAPSFIATLEPDEVLARCSPAGWLVLSDRLAGRCRRRAAQH